MSNPDWRTASWLYLEEIHKALNHFELELDSLPAQFQVIIAAMQGLESHFGLGKTRLVFWFDN